MANTFNADQVIGKTLYALQDLPIYRDPSDSANSVFTVKRGSPVGVVYSYLSPKEGRSYLYWVFKDTGGREYYAIHKQGLYDFKAIQDQGGKDTETVVKEAATANVSTRDFIATNIKTLVIIAAVAFLLKDPISKLLK